ncbi:MAG: FkbM family methyltransferase [Nevskia sp.]|nr:FkbM family methyltransferase [Nevskia sp.]
MSPFSLTRRSRKRTIPYTVEGLALELSPDHNLPKLQQDYPSYDRFLPFLARSLPAQGRCLVDIGANVGDTALALAAHTRNRIVSVEADPVFFSLLQANIARLPPSIRERIVPVQALVGSGGLKGSLVREGATGRLREDIPAAADGGFASLDAVLDAHCAGFDPVLIKVDTDGCDHDVLRSGERCLKAAKPVLFFENDIQSAESHRGFVELYGFLQDLGYRHFVLFDNFGFPMLETGDVGLVLALNQYTVRLRELRQHRTIYYFDTLAFAEDSAADVRASVEAFLADRMRAADTPR